MTAPQDLTEERAAFEAAWLEIMGGNAAWTVRADEVAQGDRATYSEVWTRRAWLLWRKARGALLAGAAEGWREFLEFWIHEGHLQTFEDRERFRGAARVLLDAPGAAAAESTNSFHQIAPSSEGFAASEESARPVAGSAPTEQEPPL